MCDYFQLFHYQIHSDTFKRCISYKTEKMEQLTQVLINKWTCRLFKKDLIFGESNLFNLISLGCGNVFVSILVTRDFCISLFALIKMTSFFYVASFLAWPAEVFSSGREVMVVKGSFCSDSITIFCPLLFTGMISAL